MCDKCGKPGDRNEDKSFYNKFCELRAKHFPANKNAYLALPGLQNRFRFKLKLTFATVKPDGYLFYNGRLERRGLHNNANDFVALRIEQSYLVFSYSLGSSQPSEIRLDNITVSDGKWRTVSIVYEHQTFVISLDNDNLQEVDACELAYNNIIDNSMQLIDCFRVKSTYELPEKCASQIETCFRHFDLNGPLNLGRASVQLKSNQQLFNYEGCISDLTINERLIDLQQEAIVDHNTQVGCSPKSNSVCKKLITNGKCAKCQPIWADKVKCESTNLDDKQTFSLSSNSYLRLAEVQLNKSFQLEFNVRVSNSSANQSFTLAYFEMYSLREAKPTVFYLIYNRLLKQIELFNEKNLKLFQLATDLEDLYWNKVFLNFAYQSKGVSFTYTINDYFVSTEVVLAKNQGLRVFIGADSALKKPGLTGCIKITNTDLLVLRESVNIAKGCGALSDKSRVMSKAISKCGSINVCFNNATCFEREANQEILPGCECLPGFKGKYCQYETKLTRNLLNKNNSCPAKWWGNEPGICGPCKCDEAKNFSPDCNQLNGTCQCKPLFYKKINKHTGEEYCVPCDCYLEGSSSLQCESLTGQCSCLTGAGITGRRCDQCVSPFAELTSNGNECRQLSSSECPRAFKFNMWWPRTPFHQIAKAECPKGTIGMKIVLFFDQFKKF